MTGRRRLHHILNRKPLDRLSWTTLVDPVAMSILPDRERAMTTLEFYRRIGCDILQFGNHGLPKHLRVPAPSRAVGVESKLEVATDADGLRTERTTTEWGVLTRTTKRGHPIKYPVETLHDLRVCTEIWWHTRFEEVPGAMEEGFRRAEEAIGADGMFIPTINPSPVQQLIELDMGQQGFYYLLHDHPREMEELLDVMHDRRKQEYEILARRTPAEAIIPVENTSSTLISPALYERYSLPQIRDYGDICRRHGKKMVLHMCGLLKNLLPIIRRADPGGYNAVTPPTVGDTTFEHAMDLLGEDVVIFGGIFNGNVFQKPGATRGEIHAELDRLYTPRLRRAHLCLWLGADGLPTELDRFLAVKDWMDRNGHVGSRASVGSTCSTRRPRPPRPTVRRNAPSPLSIERRSP
jgi:hypothetical protein